MELVQIFLIKKNLNYNYYNYYQFNFLSFFLLLF